MYLTLEDIDSEINSKPKSNTSIYLEEGMKFLLFMGSVFVFGMIFINLTTFMDYFKDKIGIGGESSTQVLARENISLNTNVSDALIPGADISRGKVLGNIDKQLAGVKGGSSILESDMDLYLKNKINKYNFQFNLLPPDKRIMIPEIGVNAPIAEVDTTNTEKIRKGDYDEDLYKGVVKYPFTPNPGEKGNILVFGHTSYYWWKKNPYGEIFAKMPKLDKGSVITILWNGKKYEYEVIEKTVKTPKQVGEAYENYKDGNYLSIMGCYPIGTDAKRMIIIAKQK